MSRLHDEWRRLWGAPWAGTGGDAGVAVGLGGAADVADAADATPSTRVLVLELARPADWTRLAPVWAGVQAEFGWSAPGIAVSGRDGLQLWFAFSRPVALSQALALGQALVARHLADLPAHRLSLLPAAEAGPTGTRLRMPAPVPAEQAGGGRWSAFVAQDLAPLFCDTPWLDLPPGDDAQARLLAALDPVTPALFDAALAQVGRPAPAAPAMSPGGAAPHPAPEAEGMADAATGRWPAEPAAFLLAVMRDDNVPLALRIEAAKALLPQPQGASRR